MKKLCFLFIALVLLAFVAACSSSKEYANFEELGNGAVLKYGDITYTFFGVLNEPLIKGKQFGIVAGDKKHKIYEVSGFPTREWVIEYLDVIMSTYSLYKADNVSEIPDEMRQTKLNT